MSAMSHPFRRIFLLLLLFVWLPISACSRSPDMIKLSGETQGTTYHFTYWADKTQQIPSPETIQKTANKALSDIDVEMSNYREDSLIEQFNRSPATAPVAFSADFIEMVRIAREVGIATQGCYDLTIKPIFDVWGFKADVFHEPSAEEITQSLAQIGMDKLVLDDATHMHKIQASLHIDTGSIGQGYSVGKIAAIFDDLGIHNYLVEIGGEMQVKGTKPDGNAWRIAVDKPLSDSHSWQKVISVNSAEPIAIMTSGTYRHFFEHNGKRYSHILDARTGSPITHNTVSITILHNNATWADGWDTALLCLGREAGIKIADQYGIAALFIEQTPTGLVEYPSAAFNQMPGVKISNQ